MELSLSSLFTAAPTQGGKVLSGAPELKKAGMYLMEKIRVLDKLR